MNINLNKQITAIVPFLNEEKYLEESVKRLINTNLFQQIVLVNDNSTDKSREIAETLCSKFEYIELINLDVQKGKGNAIKVALEEVNRNSPYAPPFSVLGVADIVTGVLSVFQPAAASPPAACPVGV